MNTFVEYHKAQSSVHSSDTQLYVTVSPDDTSRNDDLHKRLLDITQGSDAERETDR